MKAASVSPHVHQIAFCALIGIDMRKTLLFLAFSLAAGAAQAQIKCWNEGGKRVCGDAPPAGAKVTTLKAPAAPDAPAASKAAASKDAPKGPLTPAQREQEAKKREADEKKAAEKTAAKEKETAAKLENCERAKAAVRTYDSGQRISQVDAKGERVFLDDAQIASEKAKAQQAVKDSCG